MFERLRGVFHGRRAVAQAFAQKKAGKEEGERERAQRRGGVQRSG